MSDQGKINRWLGFLSPDAVRFLKDGASVALVLVRLRGSDQTTLRSKRTPMTARDPAGAETWLLSLPPTRRQTRWVIAIALCQVAALVLLAPFASIQLAQINGFVPAVGGVIFVTNLVTAVLLFSQFATHRRRALLVLACGYLLSALMVMAYTLTFPGAFSPTGLLGAGLQTTAWLYWSWHLPFALVLLGYGLIRDEKSESGPAQASSLAVIVRSVALVLVLASGLTLLTTAGHDYLPVLFAGTISRVRPLPTQGIAPITTLVCVSALAALWLRRRRSLLDQWLMVVALAAILEIGLTVLLSNRRFDLGFYAGRVFSLLTSTIVLVVLLVETMRLYANLRELNETLEQRVQAETRERLQIWNVSQDLLVIADLDGKILSVNAAWTAILGWSEAELLGKSYQWLLHPDDRERTRSEFDHLVKGHKTLHFENRLLARDGSYHWVSWTAAPDGGRIYGMGRDITEQKRAQEALRESERNLRSAIDGIPGLVAILAPNGEVETINRQIIEYCGLSIEGLKNWETDGTIHHEDVAHLAEVFSASITSGVPYQIEARFRRLDGEYRWFDMRGVPVRDDSGRIVRWYVLLTDIEDRTQALTRLQQMQSDFAHMNRVSIMGELAASLSHEITQPIASARNNARAAMNFLNKEPPELGEVREALGCVVGDADRAGDIVSGIREQIKKAPPRKDHFDLNAAISEVIVLARSVFIRNGVSVQTRLSDGLSPVHGDRVQLQQVALNLILNAVEAMGSVDGGARELLISSEQDNTGALVAVRDTGPGIDPAHLDRVFEAFYTTKSGGTGMGLSICRSIVDAHGGRLWAGANERRGAVFQFTLPGVEVASLNFPQSVHGT
jgi:PAS domain S-box-containing protein